jgi:hypothetical protein
MPFAEWKAMWGFKLLSWSHVQVLISVILLKWLPRQPPRCANAWEYIRFANYELVTGAQPVGSERQIRSVRVSWCADITRKMYQFASDLQMICFCTVHVQNFYSSCKSSLSTVTGDDNWSKVGIQCVLNQESFKTLIVAIRVSQAS